MFNVLERPKEAFPDHTHCKQYVAPLYTSVVFMKVYREGEVKRMGVPIRGRQQTHGRRRV